MKKILFVCLLTLILSVGAFAAGQSDAPDGSDYPRRPITVIVPFDAGGGMDTTARQFASLAQEHLGTSLAIVNRSGAGGTIGIASLARADADGYTIGFGTNGAFSVLPLTQNVDYELGDFETIGGININHVILITNTNSPYETLDDVLNADTTLTYGTSGAGGIPHISMDSFLRLTDVQTSHVPFQSTGEAVTQILGNHIDLAAAHPNLAQAGLEDGRIRVLGVFADERIESLPDVPTFKEMGYDVSLSLYNVILAPAGTPDYALETLRTGFARMLADPRMQENARNRNLVLYPISADQVQRDLQADRAAAEQTLSELGLID